jgi:hypothetical protein
MLGGVFWIAHAVAVALMPVGCIADECDIRPIGDSSAAAPLFIAAVLLIGAGLAAVVRRARHAGRFGVSGRLGLIAAVTGVVTILGAGLVQGVFFRGDFPLMPYIVLPAGLAVVIGFLLLGIALLRSGILPRWTAALLVVGTLALLGVNDQNAQILLAIPCGIAWVAVGYVFREGERSGRAEATSTPLPGT